MMAKNVRIAIFDAPTGGVWDVAFSVRQEIDVGGLVAWGPPERRVANG
jgi:hypothetical protein